MTTLLLSAALALGIAYFHVRSYLRRRRMGR